MANDELKKDVAVTQNDIKHLEETTNKIWEKLDAQGDVRKDLDDHVKAHWRITSLFLTLVGLLGYLLGKK